MALPVPSEFKLMRGVMQLPGYADSPETARVEFNLQGDGVGLDDGAHYSPRHTQTKGGGIWSDSAVVSGRFPLALPYGNVVESVNFKVTKTTYKELNEKLTELGNMVSACKRFGTSHSFIDPVYVSFKQDTTTKTQYALLHDLNFELTYQGVVSEQDNTPMALVTISWEREYGWRAIPLGTSPVYYSLIADGQIPGTDFDYTDLNPLSASSLVYETAFTNRLEYEFGGGQDSPTLSVNYITIPKEDIPGDLPALCMIDIGDNSAGSEGGKPDLRRVYIGHSVTPRLPVPNTFVNNFNDQLVYAGGDADHNPFSTPTYQANTGVLSNASTVTRYSIDLAFAAGAIVAGRDLSWGAGSGGSANTVDYQIRANSLRGKHHVFIRQNLTSGTGSEMEFYLRFSPTNDSGSFSVDTNTFNPTSVTGGGNTDWALQYLGVVSLPLGDRVNTQTHDGNGLLNVDDNTITISMWHNAKASGTGALTLRVCDIILLPYDTFFCENEIPGTSSLSIRQLSIDNTCYLTHGANRQKASFTRVLFPETLAPSPVLTKGRSPYLIPGVDNRLYFLMTTYNGSGEEVCQTTVESDTVQIGINIIPRWSGVRDD